MMKVRKRTLGVSVLVAITIAIVIECLPGPKQARLNPRQTLADGSVLTLLQVAYGKTNALTGKNSVLNIADLGVNLDRTDSTTVSTNEELVFWLRRTFLDSKVPLEPASNDAWKRQWVENTCAI